MNLNIDPNWSFEQIVEHLDQIKDDVWKVLNSYTYFQIQQKNNFQKSLRNQICSLNLKEWQTERIYEFIFGDIDMEVLKNIIQK